MSKSQKTTGISHFFERFVLDPVSRRVVIDVRSGQVMGVIYQEKEVTENKEVPPKLPIIVTDETTIQRTEQIESATVADVEEERLWAQMLAEEAEGKKENEEDEEDKLNGVVNSPSLWVPEDAEIKKKKYDIEKRHPEIRKKLIAILIERVLPRPEFSKPANNSTINTVFNRLKQRFIERSDEKGWVIPVEQINNKEFRFDKPGIAALLYLSNLNKKDFDKLENSQRSEVQKIAEEVYAEAERYYKSTQLSDANRYAE